MSEHRVRLQCGGRDTELISANRCHLHGSVCGAEASLKVTGLMTMNRAGTGGAKEKVESGSSAQGSCQLGWGQHSSESQDHRITKVGKDL